MSIIADFPMDWDTSNTTHVRVSLPSSIENILLMQQKGYQYVERMLDVTIGLKRNKIDLQKLIRIPPILRCDYKEEIKVLAKKSFVKDRRFYVEIDYNSEIANQIIDDWIEKIPEFYICLYKEKVIGFLALKEVEDGQSAMIHLAAVDERYRTSGAAISLYAKAMEIGIEKGYQNIYGYISCNNVAVMNLYAYLGGIFSNPQDIYLKK